DGVGRVAVVEADRFLDRFQQGPERDPLAIGKAPSAGDERLAGDVCQELPHEARLSDAGKAEHREQLARSVTYGLVEGVAQTPPLALSPDHRRREPARRQSSVAPK